jgi:hypothetical protein
MQTPILRSAISYRPAGAEGPRAPRPSHAGYYVLNTPTPPKDAKATILIAAQDNSFATSPIANAPEIVKDLIGLAREH